MASGWILTYQPWSLHFMVFSCFWLQVNDLAKTSSSISTLSALLDHDIEGNCVRKAGSNSRNLLRVKRGLDMVRVLFEHMLASEYVWLLFSCILSFLINSWCSSWRTRRIKRHKKLKNNYFSLFWFSKKMEDRYFSDLCVYLSLETNYNLRGQEMSYELYW